MQIHRDVGKKPSSKSPATSFGCHKQTKMSGIEAPYRDCFCSLVRKTKAKKTGVKGEFCPWFR